MFRHAMVKSSLKMYFLWCYAHRHVGPFYKKIYCLYFQIYLMNLTKISIGCWHKYEYKIWEFLFYQRYYKYNCGILKIAYMQFSLNHIYGVSQCAVLKIYIYTFQFCPNILRKSHIGWVKRFGDIEILTFSVSGTSCLYAYLRKKIIYGLNLKIAYINMIY